MTKNEQFDNSEQLNPEEMSNNEFQTALEEAMSKQFEKVRMAGMLSGAKGICGVIMQYIYQFNSSPGKKTLNDHRRLVKKINDFCSVSLSKKIDEQTGEIVRIEPDEELAE
jgi:hypothetical protein